MIELTKTGVNWSGWDLVSPTVVKDKHGTRMTVVGIDVDNRSSEESWPWYIVLDNRGGGYDVPSMGKVQLRGYHGELFRVCPMESVT